MPCAVMISLCSVHSRARRNLCDQREAVALAWRGGPVEEICDHGTVHSCSTVMTLCPGPRRRHAT